MLGDGQSIESIYYSLMEKEASNESETSHLFLPGHHIKIYGNFTPVCSSKRRLCTYCSSVINVGSTYIRYNPLLFDVTAK